MNAPPCVKPGEKPNACAIALYLQEIERRIDLPSEGWNGWKIRGDWLIGPGGMKFNARSLRAAWRNYIKAGLAGTDGSRPAIQQKSA